MTIDLTNPKATFTVPNTPGQFSAAVPLEGFRAAGRALYCGGAPADQIRLYLGASNIGPWKKSAAIFGTQGAVIVESLPATHARVERVSGSTPVTAFLIGDVDNELERTSGGSSSGAGGSPIKYEATNDTATASNAFVELVSGSYTTTRPVVVVTASASINILDAGGRASFRLVMDGTPIASGGASLDLAVGKSGTIAIQGGVGNAAPGPHTIKLEWRAPEAATIQCRPDSTDEEHASIIVNEFDGPV